MKILLDECIPARLKAQFTDVHVRTARDEQWTGIRNGELLTRMRAGNFQVLVTVDRNLTYQQNVALSGIAVIVMHARTNRLVDLVPLVEEVLVAIRSVQPGDIRRIGV